MRELARLGLPERFLYVVEVQEDRWKEHGVFAPHLHTVIPNRWTNGGYLLRYETTDGILGRILSNVLHKPVNVSSACKLQPIHGIGQLADYMTKFERIGRYLSKGSKMLAEIRATGVPLPKSWYGSDLDTKQQVRASLLTVRVEDTDVSRLAEAIDLVEACLGRSIFTMPFLVEIEGVEWIVSSVTKVKNLVDIPHALPLLLPLLVDSS
jgi:hypothetical protein